MSAAAKEGCVCVVVRGPGGRWTALRHNFYFGGGCAYDEAHATARAGALLGACRLKHPQRSFKLRRSVAR